MSKNEDKSPLVYRKNRTIYFFDEVGEESVLEAFKLMKELEQSDKNKPIEFVINSVGGSVHDGLALYDRLRQSECDIVTIGTGIVASISLLIYLAGEKRLVTENTRLLNHQGQGDIEGKTSDIEINYKELQKVEDIVNNLIAERTGITLSKIEKEIKVGDVWIGAEQAVEDGYAHEVIFNKRTRRKRKKKKKK